MLLLSLAPYLQANHNFFQAFFFFLREKHFIKLMYGVQKDFYSYVLKFYLILMRYSDDKNGPQILNAVSEAFNKKIKGCIPNSSCESRVLHSKEDSVNYVSKRSSL